MSRSIYERSMPNRYFLEWYLRQRVKTVAYVVIVSGKIKHNEEDGVVARRDKLV